MVKKILIWGASGHASVIIDILRMNGEYEIVGLIDDINPNPHGRYHNGVPILGGREQLDLMKDHGVDYGIIAIGDCDARLKLAEVMISAGYKLANAQHSSAVIANDVSIGEGTVVAAGAVINPGVKLGRNVIINTGATVDHDCIVEDGAHICPGVHLAGYVHIGRGVWVGIGSTVIDRIHIGSGAYIRAGSVVVMDVQSNSVVYGVPARPKR